MYFRCYRYLGKLLNLFNFIGIINYLWHVGDIYLVTQTPDRMLMHWGRMQMYITYMGMFWGKTLWLDVCVMFGVGSWASDPQRGCRVLLDPGVEWERTCMRSTGQGFPLWIKQHWNGPYELSSTPIHHTSTANNTATVSTCIPYHNTNIFVHICICVSVSVLLTLTCSHLCFSYIHKDGKSLGGC